MHIKVDDGPPPMLPEHEPPSNDAYLEPEQPAGTPPPHAPMQEVSPVLPVEFSDCEMLAVSNVQFPFPDCEGC